MKRPYGQISGWTPFLQNGGLMIKTHQNASFDFVLISKCIGAILSVVHINILHCQADWTFAICNSVEFNLSYPNSEYPAYSLSQRLSTEVAFFTVFAHAHREILALVSEHKFWSLNGYSICWCFHLLHIPKLSDCFGLFICLFRLKIAYISDKYVSQYRWAACNVLLLLNGKPTEHSNSILRFIIMWLLKADPSYEWRPNQAIGR